MKDHRDFFEKVYSVVGKIPFGRVTSYGAIANFLGMKRSARMVGWALSRSFAANENIPAHRVVNRNGSLTGKHHFSGPGVMKQLLENEGVEIINDQIVHFEKYFWDPAKELK
jgi:methylated-DNA-protein-cysteine methyltransferase-like protein